MNAHLSLALVALLCANSGSCHAADPAAATQAALTKALEAFLAQHGDICLAKYDWPIDVSARDVAAGTRDALQMPALEAQGLVKSSDGFVVFKTDDVQTQVPTRRYELTALGQRFYKVREPALHRDGGRPVAHPADLCAGHLDLDTVVKVTVRADTGASVSYRYRYKPEAWVDNPQIRRVFPMLDLLIQGQGTREMTQHFHLDGGRWVADLAFD